MPETYISEGLVLLLLSGSPYYISGDWLHTGVGRLFVSVKKKTPSI